MSEALNPQILAAFPPKPDITNMTPWGPAGGMIDEQVRPMHAKLLHDAIAAKDGKTLKDAVTRLMPAMAQLQHACSCEGRHLQAMGHDGNFIFQVLTQTLANQVVFLTKKFTAGNEIDPEVLGAIMIHLSYLMQGTLGGGFEVLHEMQIRTPESAS